MSGIPLLHLLAKTEDNFFLMDLDATVFSTKNSDGTVNAVSIKDDENIIKCLKVIDVVNGTAVLFIIPIQLFEL